MLGTGSFTAEPSTGCCCETRWYTLTGQVLTGPWLHWLTNRGSRYQSNFSTFVRAKFRGVTGETVQSSNVTHQETIQLQMFTQYCIEVSIALCLVTNITWFLNDIFNEEKLIFDLSHFDPFFFTYFPFWNITEICTRKNVKLLRYRDPRRLRMRRALPPPPYVFIPCCLIKRK
jgi:hypothetical protein